MKEKSWFLLEKMLWKRVDEIKDIGEGADLKEDRSSQLLLEKCSDYGYRYKQFPLQRTTGWSRDT